MNMDMLTVVLSNQSYVYLLINEPVINNKSGNLIKLAYIMGLDSWLTTKCLTKASYKKKLVKHFSKIALNTKHLTILNI